MNYSCPQCQSQDLAPAHTGFIEVGEWDSNHQAYGLEDNLDQAFQCRSCEQGFYLGPVLLMAGPDAEDASDAP